MENASKALIIAGAILISILLITIGIVLINSGRNVTTQGTAQMASQTIQAFNSNYTIYEGTKKGSELINMINIAKANNTTDKAHQVIIYAPAAELNNAKNYDVELRYYQEGVSASPLYNGGKSNMKLVCGDNTATKSEEGYIHKIYIHEK